MYILSLAAYERARRALRGECEPNSAALALAELGSQPRFGCHRKKTSHRGGLFPMAAELGFEPRHTESESAVLPLHNSAKLFSAVYILAYDAAFVKGVCVFSPKKMLLFD